MDTVISKKIVVTLSILFCFSFITKATNYNVTNTTDGNGLNQLRGAIGDAALTAGPHTINIAAGMYNLSLGTINFGNLVNQDITFIGADSSATIINMTTTLQGRIFNIGNSLRAGVKISFSNIKFTGGKAGLTGTDGFGGGAFIGGGPNCIITVNRCVFDNNTIDAALGGFGAAVTMQGGGVLTITNSNFRNNVNAGFDGGAVDYYLRDSVNITGALTITGCTFFNNSVTAPSSSGGALNIVSQTGTTGQTFAVNVQKNTFISNHSDAAGDAGGAIVSTNSFSTSNTAVIQYNRFVSNTSNVTSTAGLAVSPADGRTDASNNWWGCSNGPVSGTGCDKAAQTATGGSLIATPYLTLKLNSTPTSLCSAAPFNTAVLTASFLQNSSNIAVAASNLDVLIGLPVSFTTGGLGTVSGAQTTIQSSGTATANFTANEGGSGGTVTAMVDNGPSSTSLTINAATLPAVARTITQTVGTTSNYYLNGCEFINRIVPSGAAPVSGSITSRVWIEPGVPTYGNMPFVARHYQVTPPVAATTATVTLYFTPAEFAAFNNHPGSVLNLPTDNNDVVGKANLRIGKYAGSSNNNSGLPASYTGGVTVINPDDNNIVYNTPLARWEVTFDVAGFSGFVVQTNPFALPVKIVSFTGALKADQSAELTWDVTQQQGIDSYIVEKSADGRSFTAIGDVTANNQPAYRYGFHDTKAGPGVLYYRLRIMNSGGREELSNVITLTVKGSNSISIYPNPTNGVVTVRSLNGAVAGKAVLVDASGKLVMSINIVSTNQQIDVSALAAGVYLLKLADGSVYKINKID